MQKDCERIRDLESNVNNFELSQDDINKCIMKEQPEGLGESLKMLISKLSLINKFKEDELKVKIEEEQKKRKIIEQDSLSQLVSNGLGLVTLGSIEAGGSVLQREGS